MRRIFALITLICFLVTGTGLPAARAQGLPLPAPGTIVPLSANANPLVLRGLMADSQNPLKFEFILDRGQAVPDQNLKPESERLIKYFLAALATPENDLWVNLSPVEHDRIVPEAFGRTTMGRDMLAQDYLLKQVTASLLHPDSETGKAFWQKAYAAAYEKFGTTDIPINTFHKVWISPDKARIYSEEGRAYIIDCRMKVQLEQDYLAQRTQNSECTDAAACPQKTISASEDLSQQILREVVLPILKKDVNEGENFAALRQIYHSLILAAWFKRKLKASVLAKTYANQNKIEGLQGGAVGRQQSAGDSQPSAADGERLTADENLSPDAIWKLYMQAYQKGVFNLIREESVNGQRLTADDASVPRKYFSGGVVASAELLEAAMSFTENAMEIPANTSAHIAAVNLVAETSSTPGVGQVPNNKTAAQDERYDEQRLAQDPRNPIEIFLAHADRSKYPSLQNLIKSLLQVGYPYDESLLEVIAAHIRDSIFIASRAALIRDMQEKDRPEFFIHLIADMLSFAKDASLPGDAGQDARHFLWKLGEIDADPTASRPIWSFDDKAFDRPLPVAPPVTGDPAFDALPVLDLATGPRGALFINTPANHPLVLVDNSHFVDAFLTQIRKRLGLEKKVEISQLDITQDWPRLLQGRSFRHVRIGNVSSYLDDLPEAFYQKLTEIMPEGATISFEYRSVNQQTEIFERFVTQNGGWSAAPKKSIKGLAGEWIEAVVFTRTPSPKSAEPAMENNPEASPARRDYPRLFRQAAAARKIAHAKTKTTLTRLPGLRPQIKVRTTFVGRQGQLGKAALVIQGLQALAPNIAIDHQFVAPDEEGADLQSESARIPYIDNFPALADANTPGAPTTPADAIVDIHTISQDLLPGEEQRVFRVGVYAFANGNSQNKSWANTFDLSRPETGILLDTSLRKMKQEKDALWKADDIARHRKNWSQDYLSPIEQGLLKDLSEQEGWDPFQAIWSSAYFRAEAPFQKHIASSVGAAQQDLLEPYFIKNGQGRQLIVFALDYVDPVFLNSLGINVIAEQKLFPATAPRVPLTVIAGSRKNQAVRELVAQMTGTLQRSRDNTFWVEPPILITGNPSWMEALASGTNWQHENYDAGFTKQKDIHMLVARRLALEHPGMKWEKLDLEARRITETLLVTSSSENDYRDLETATREARRFSDILHENFNTLHDILAVAVNHAAATERAMKPETTRDDVVIPAVSWKENVHVVSREPSPDGTEIQPLDILSVGAISTTKKIKYRGELYVAKQFREEGELWKQQERRYIGRQAEILSYLKSIKFSGVMEADHFITTDNGTKMILFKFDDGAPLDRLVEERALSKEQIQNLMLEVTRTAEQLQAAGVKHGDITPGNIWVQKSGAPLLADLELSFATIEEFWQRQLQYTGTPLYITADHYAVMNKIPTKETPILLPLEQRDAYGLAMSLLRMLVDPKAYYQNRDLAQFANELLAKMDAMPDISGGLKAVLRHAVQDAKSGYANVADFREALEKAVRPGTLQINRTETSRKALDAFEKITNSFESIRDTETYHLFSNDLVAIAVHLDAWGKDQPADYKDITGSLNNIEDIFLKLNGPLTNKILSQQNPPHSLLLAIKEIQSHPEIMLPKLEKMRRVFEEQVPVIRDAIAAVALADKDRLTPDLKYKEGLSPLRHDIMSNLLNIETAIDMAKTELPNMLSLRDQCLSLRENIRKLYDQKLSAKDLGVLVQETRQNIASLASLLETSDHTLFLKQLYASLSSSDQLSKAAIIDMMRKTRTSLQAAALILKTAQQTPEQTVAFDIHQLLKVAISSEILDRASATRVVHTFDSASVLAKQGETYKILVNILRSINEKLKPAGEKGLIKISTRIDGEFVDIEIRANGRPIQPQMDRQMASDNGVIVTIDSVGDEDTTFHIRLPRSPRAADKEAFDEIPDIRTQPNADQAILRHRPQDAQMAPVRFAAKLWEFYVGDAPASYLSIGGIMIWILREKGILPSEKAKNIEDKVFALIGFIRDSGAVREQNIPQDTPPEKIREMIQEKLAWREPHLKAVDAFIKDLETAFPDLWEIHSQFYACREKISDLFDLLEEKLQSLPKELAMQTDEVYTPDILARDLRDPIDIFLQYADRFQLSFPQETKSWIKEAYPDRTVLLKTIASLFRNIHLYAVSDAPAEDLQAARDKRLHTALSLLRKDLESRRMPPLFIDLMRDLVFFATTAYSPTLPANNEARHFLWKLGEIDADAFLASSSRPEEKGRFLQKLPVAAPQKGDPAFDQLPVLDIGTGPRGAFFMKNADQGELILTDNSFFVEAFLNKLISQLGLKDRVRFRRIDITRDHQAYFQDAPYRHVRVANVDAYAGKLSDAFFEDLTRALPEGATLSFEYPRARPFSPNVQAFDAFIHEHGGWSAPRRETIYGLDGEPIIAIIYTRSARPQDTASTDNPALKRAERAMISSSLRQELLRAPALKNATQPQHGKVISTKTLLKTLSPADKKGLLHELARDDADDMAYSHTYLTEILKAPEASSPDILLLVNPAGNIIGRVELSLKDRKTAWIYNLWIEEKARAKNHGSFLMETVLGYMKEQNIWKLTLAARHNALEFYIKLIPSQVAYEIRRGDPLLEFVTFPKTFQNLSEEQKTEHKNHQEILLARMKDVREVVSILRKGEGSYRLRHNKGTITFDAPARVKNKTGVYAPTSLISPELSRLDRIAEDLVFISGCELLKQNTDGSWVQVLTPSPASMSPKEEPGSAREQAMSPDKPAFVNLTISDGAQDLSTIQMLFQKERKGAIRLSGFNDPALTSGAKPALAKALASFSTALATNIIASFPNGIRTNLNTNIPDDFAPVFRSEDEQLGFIILEMIKNALVHGHKMRLDLPVTIEWDLAPSERSLNLKVYNQNISDTSLLDQISADELRFKWRLSGLRMASRFIHTLSRGNTIKLSETPDARTVAGISLPLTAGRTENAMQNADPGRQNYTKKTDIILDQLERIRTSSTEKERRRAIQTLLSEQDNGEEPRPLRIILAQIKNPNFLPYTDAISEFLLALWPHDPELFLFALKVLTDNAAFDREKTDPGKRIQGQRNLDQLKSLFRTISNKGENAYVILADTLEGLTNIDGYNEENREKVSFFIEVFLQRMNAERIGRTPREAERITQTVTQTAGNMHSEEGELGGIDMNPQALSIEETGNAPENAMIQASHALSDIKGLVPVILSIRPAENLRELLTSPR